MGKINERFKAKQLKCSFVLSNAGPRGVTLNDVMTGQLAQQIFKDHDAGVDLEAKYADKFKGHYNGLCNRSACLSPRDVHWYNTGSYAFYCPDCAHELNACNARFHDINDGGPYVHFKTAEEAAECHVMVKKINYATALKNR